MKTWMRVGLVITTLVLFISLALATFEQPVSNDTSAVTKDAKNCARLLVQLNTFDYHHPILSIAALGQVAVPSLATSLAHVPHMTAGEIANHILIRPTVTPALEPSGQIRLQVTIPWPQGTIQTTWVCITDVGNKVTALEPVR